jgi:predicted DNA binding CopG/RHH family protein
MKRKNYKTAPKDIAEAISVSEIIEDFLPPPEKLTKKEKTVRITILLNKESVDFFKKNAQKFGIHYQTMIKALLDKYTSYYQHY